MGSAWHGVTAGLRTCLGIAPVLFAGQGWIQHFGFLPRRRPLRVVVGAPVEVGSGEHHPPHLAPHPGGEGGEPLQGAGGAGAPAGGPPHPCSVTNTSTFASLNSLKLKKKLTNLSMLYTTLDTPKFGQMYHDAPDFSKCSDT